MCGIANKACVSSSLMFGLVVFGLARAAGYCTSVLVSVSFAVSGLYCASSKLASGLLPLFTVECVLLKLKTAHGGVF